MTDNSLSPFLKAYWSHPFWSQHEEIKTIRLSFLPSKYQEAVLKVKLKPQEENFSEEGLIHGQAVSGLHTLSRRGMDLYYFVNPIHNAGTFAKTEHVLCRLYLVLDIDFRLPVEVGEFIDELGLRPWITVQSSMREFPRYQFLFAINDGAFDDLGRSDLAARELTKVTGSDPVHDSKRIMRLPGFVNWKGVKTAEDRKFEAVMLDNYSYYGEESYCYETQNVLDACDKFGSGKLSLELRALGFRGVRREAGAAQGSTEGADGTGQTQRGTRGDYGAWDHVKERAEKGEWSVPDGARHWALCSYGVQMAADRLPLKIVIDNLRLIADKGCETPFDDEKDFTRIIAGVSDKWRAIDHELEDIFAFDGEISDKTFVSEKNKGAGEENGKENRRRKAQGHEDNIRDAEDNGKWEREGQGVSRSNDRGASGANSVSPDDGSGVRCEDKRGSRANSAGGLRGASSGEGEGAGGNQEGFRTPHRTARRPGRDIAGSSPRDANEVASTAQNGPRAGSPLGIRDNSVSGLQSGELEDNLPACGHDEARDSGVRRRNGADSEGVAGEEPLARDDTPGEEDSANGQTANGGRGDAVLQTLDRRPHKLPRLRPEQGTSRRAGSERTNLRRASGDVQLVREGTGSAREGGHLDTDVSVGGVCADEVAADRGENGSRRPCDGDSTRGINGTGNSEHEESTHGDRDESAAGAGEETTVSTVKRSTARGSKSKLNGHAHSSHGSAAQQPIIEGAGSAVLVSEGEQTVLVRPHHITAFAQTLTLQMEGESSDEYTDFLASVLASAIYGQNADVGNWLKLGKVVFGRLERAGCLEGRYFAVPLQLWGVVPYGAMVRLSEDQSRVLIRDLVGELSYLCGRKRAQLAEHPFVVAVSTGVKKPKFVFSASGRLLSAVEEDVLLRASTTEFSRRSVPEHAGKIVAFQNGVFHLDKFLAFEGGEACARAEALIECFVRNRDSKSLVGCGEGGKFRGARTSLSWIQYRHVSSMRFSIDVARDYLQEIEGICWDVSRETLGEVGSKDIAAVLSVWAPKLMGFLESAFPADYSSWRGVLRIIGYCLLEHNPFQKYFYLEGLAGGGKGTLAELILACLPLELGGRLALSRMKSDAWLGPLEGCGVVVIDEAEEDDKAAHKKVCSELARVTGGDYVSARSLRMDARDIRCTQKFILTTNRGLDAQDAQGQQERRAVPVNFAHKPTGRVVESLYRVIASVEGGAICSMALCELAWNFELGAGEFFKSRMFARGPLSGKTVKKKSINSDEGGNSGEEGSIDEEGDEGIENLGEEMGSAFLRGRERFQESTSLVRNFLTTVTRPGRNNLSSSLLEKLVYIFLRVRHADNDMFVQLDRRVVSEMEGLGAVRGLRDIILPLKEESLAFGIVRAGRGFRLMELQTEALLSELEMSPAELVREIRRLSLKQEKIWHLAAGALDIPWDIFLSASRDNADMWNTPAVMPNETNFR